ncbi:MAG: hypothetical protein U0996_18430 [Planctomycetaceae bacterium]
MSISDAFTNWLLDAKSFFERLNASGGAFNTYAVDIAPPMSAAAFTSLQDSLSRQLPPLFREILTSSTSRATLRYVWDPPDHLKPALKEIFGQRYIYGGGTLFDSASLALALSECQEAATESWLADEEFEADQRFWLSGIPFLRMPNSDYLAIDPETESVSYLSHDSTSSFVGSDLMSFLNAWQRVGYAGPESWIIRKFIDTSTGYLGFPNKNQAEGIHRLFGK